MSLRSCLTSELKHDLGHMLSFNPIEWPSFIDKSCGSLESSCFIPRLVQRTDYIVELIQKAIENIYFYNERPLFRVFVDGGLRFDLVEKIQRTKYNALQDIDSWAQEIIGASKYCLALNGVSRWSDDLHNEIAESIIEPLVEQHGLPIGGVESYIFAGDYDYTPFGIHEDPDHSLILHLGPGVKDLWIWPHSKFLELAKDSNRRYDFDTFCKTGNHLCLKPGDFVFIPKGDFHVFKNNGFSLFLGLILFPSTAESIAKRSAEVLFAENTSAEFFSTGSVESISKSICERISKNGTFETVGRDLSRAIVKSMHMLKSNSFDVHKPPLRDLTRAEPIEEKTFRLVKNSGLDCVVDDGLVCLFARGRMIQLRANISVLRFLQFLYKEKDFTYGDARSMLSKDLGEDVIHSLMASLLQIRALTTNCSELPRKMLE
jgi:hypothetical protein